MKRSILTATILLVIPLSAHAQTETILSRDAEKGGYGGPTVKFMQAAGDFGLLVGGQGAFVWGRTFAVGGGGWGLTTEHTITDQALNDYDLDFGYGGILFQYLRDPGKVVHWDAELLVAWGDITFRPLNGGTRVEETLMVFEPAAHAMLNISEGLRVGLGFGYRFVTRFSDTVKTQFDISESVVDGYSVNVTFRFGRY